MLLDQEKEIYKLNDTLFYKRRLQVKANSKQKIRSSFFFLNSVFKFPAEFLTDFEE